MWPHPLGDDSGGIAESDAETTAHQGDTVFHYELHQLRSAELGRIAEHDRLVREVLRARRAARRSAGGRTAEAEPHTHRPHRHRFTRAA